MTWLTSVISNTPRSLIHIRGKSSGKQKNEGIRVWNRPNIFISFCLVVLHHPRWLRFSPPPSHCLFQTFATHFFGICSFAFLTYTHTFPYIYLYIIYMLENPTSPFNQSDTTPYIYAWWVHIVHILSQVMFGESYTSMNAYIQKHSEIERERESCLCVHDPARAPIYVGYLQSITYILRTYTDSVNDMKRWTAHWI